MKLETYRLEKSPFYSLKSRQYRHGQPALPIPRLVPGLHSHSALSTAGIFAELIKGENPLVENPLGASNDRAAPMGSDGVP